MFDDYEGMDITRSVCDDCSELIVKVDATEAWIAVESDTPLACREADMHTAVDASLGAWVNAMWNVRLSY